MKKNKVIKHREPEAPCPLSRPEFLISAQDLELVLHGKTFVAVPRNLPPDKDGRVAFGWQGGGESAILFDDVPVPVKIRIQVICTGSKDA